MKYHKVKDETVVDSKPEGDLTSDVEAREGDMHPQTKMVPGRTMYLSLIHI